MNITLTKPDGGIYVAKVEGLTPHIREDRPPGVPVADAEKTYWVSNMFWDCEGDPRIEVIESPDQINTLILAAAKAELNETISRRGAHEALREIAKALAPKSKTTREACNEADERKARIAACEALTKIAKNGIDTYGHNLGRG